MKIEKQGQFYRKVLPVVPDSPESILLPYIRLIPLSIWGGKISQDAFSMSFLIVAMKKPTTFRHSVLKQDVHPPLREELTCNSVDGNSESFVSLFVTEGD